MAKKQPVSAPDPVPADVVSELEAATTANLVVLERLDGSKAFMTQDPPYPRAITHDGRRYERAGTDDGVEVYREPAF